MNNYWQPAYVAPMPTTIGGRVHWYLPSRRGRLAAGMTFATVWCHGGEPVEGDEIIAFATVAAARRAGAQFILPAAVAGWREESLGCGTCRVVHLLAPLPGADS